jgi:hypothetical protein
MREELTIDPEHFEPNTSHDARPPLLADKVALVTGAIAASAPKSRAGSPTRAPRSPSPHATRTRVS